MTVKAATAAGLLRKPRGDCHRCGKPVTPPPGSRRWKFCSDECFMTARAERGHRFAGIAKADTRSRGYGAEHQRLREELLPLAYEIVSR